MKSKDEPTILAMISPQAYGVINDYIGEKNEQIEKLQEALKIAIEILEHKSKRSSYEWSDGGDYFPSDYANEGQLKCASEILAEIRKLRGEG